MLWPIPLAFNHRTTYMKTANSYTINSDTNKKHIEQHADRLNQAAAQKSEYFYAISRKNTVIYT